MRYLGFVAVVALVVTAGCIGGDFEPMDVDIEPDVDYVDTDETGDEILASSVEAVGDTEAHAVEADNRMKVGASGLFSMSMSMNSTAEFDGDEAAYVSSDGGFVVDALGLFDNETRFETETYATPSATYTRSAEGDESLGDWNVNDTGTDDHEMPLGFDGMPLSVGDIEALTNDTDAELEGVATVDGDEAYVLSLDSNGGEAIVHSMLTFDTYGSDELDETEEGGEPEDGEEFDEGDLDRFDAYLWVDRDTRQPVRLSYYILATGLEDEGEDDEMLDVEGAMEFYFDSEYSYDDVEVETPDGLD